MEYLLVSATGREIRPLLDAFSLDGLRDGDTASVNAYGHRLTVLVTGVGMMQAAFHTGVLLSGQSFDHAIQAGIAGAFDRELALGEVVEVVSQQYGDLGFFADGHITDVFDMGLMDADRAPWWRGKLLNPGKDNRRHATLSKVSGLSVNSVTSQQDVVMELQARYGAQVESMEGIGFQYACLSRGQEYAEIRAISNYVEPRDRGKWQVETAVAALNAYLLDWMRG